MVGIATAPNSKTITILGHGIKFSRKFEITEGIHIDPSVPLLDTDNIADRVDALYEFSAILTMGAMANFSVVVEHPSGARELAAKAWNALWKFHYLSLACATPCFSLFSLSGNEKPVYAIANRNLIINTLPNIHTATNEQINWAKLHWVNFERLINDQRFTTALLYYANAHYLFDVEPRIMLLWAGIEGLLDVNGEQRRRLALYTALMLKGSHEEKYAHFNKVKKAYDVRSKIVHGAKDKNERLNEHYQFVGKILVMMLARCVELRRVPTPDELDKISVSAEWQEVAP